jgi:hypothetical protein
MAGREGAKGRREGGQRVCMAPGQPRVACSTGSTIWTGGPGNQGGGNPNPGPGHLRRE